MSGIADGYHILPPGKLANAVTWLELTELRPRDSANVGLTLRRLGPAEAGLHRRLYREVGERWLWSGLLGKDEQGLARHLARPEVMSFAAVDGGEPIGLLELERGPEGLEIVYLGLIAAAEGRGRGAWLMGEAIRLAAAAGERRLWLHTCTFDSPRALDFYRRQGFRVYAVGFEVMDDPRVAGLLPPTAAPHVPLVEG